MTFVRAYCGIDGNGRLGLGERTLAIVTSGPANVELLDVASLDAATVPVSEFRAMRPIEVDADQDQALQRRLRRRYRHLKSLGAPSTTGKFKRATKRRVARVLGESL